ncbi:BlaI/MecI/CopY family transcriptional regulator [Actinoplanes solisilvae]|uniref:BlaI/MecI/CopY family transcriptional regulator n=1 Tax=Actinoplanes solisilvae TaxID=2486853 RepID=UPI000FD71EED|nr:BlaI/MecI/CopY family transcriptional regulator [Actinoplanes solisilvae]
MAGEDQDSGRRRSGALESEILGVLQKADGPLTPRDVLLRLSGLSYSTVVTILTRLHTKGILARYREGRAFRYAPLTDSASLAAERMSAALDTESDHASVLRRFVDKLEPGDEELLRSFLRED